jgi:hypothetical protein
MRILFLPFSLIGGLIAGLVASKVFAKLWKLVAREDEPPGADDPDVGVARVVAATAMQSAVFGASRTLFDRGARRWFEHTFGAYPRKKGE